MIVRLGSFSKEINSTKQPSVTEWTSLNCQLKGDCSIQQPSIILERGSYDTSYNYAYIPSWGRYYFVSDATCMTGERWKLDLAVDVLATWKSYITSASAYVSRSASNYSNKIPDSCWSHSSDNTVSVSEIDCGLSTTGIYLLFTTSDDGQSTLAAIPSQSVYAVTGTHLKEMCNYLFSSDFFNSATSGLDTATQTLSKTFFNPFQYITKCMWLPIDMSSISGSSGTINFGWWESSVTATVCGIHYVKKTFTFTPGTYSTWIDRDASWTSATLYVPGFGQMTIASDYIGMTLTGTIIIDLASGDAGLFLKTSGGTIIASASGKLGCDIQLSSLYEDIISDVGTKASAITTGIKSIAGAVTNAFSTAKDAIETGGIKGLLSNAGNVASSAVTGAQSALQPTMSTIGANGTKAIIENENKAVLSITKFSLYEDIHDRLGGMCNKILTLSTLSGYTEVVNPHVQCPATSGEITMINAFLSGGFYLE